MHGSIRLFVAAPLAPGIRLDAAPEQAHYLGSVMRARIDDVILIFNGMDGEWRARITQIGRGRATLTVETQTRPQPPDSGPWLAFALLKRDATELVVQKATELGAARILPLRTARTQLARVNLARLRAIAIEAAEQCERLTIPCIDELQSLPDLWRVWPAERRLAAAVERSTAAPPAASAGGLLVGPEGGFTPEELDDMRRLSFVVPVSLGPLILRAETASIAGLALLQVLSMG